MFRSELIQPTSQGAGHAELLWNADSRNCPATLFPKPAVQTGIPFVVSQERKVAEEEEYCNRLAGTLLPFANNKTEFLSIGSQFRKK